MSFHLESKRVIGTRYEEKAADYLVEKGFRILEKNVNYRWGEIDLVAIDPFKNELVFVEVRFRSEGAMVEAVESLTFSKLTRLKRAIQTYLNGPSVPQGMNGIRIDLVAIEGEKLFHWPDFI